MSKKNPRTEEDKIERRIAIAIISSITIVLISLLVVLPVLSAQSQDRDQKNYTKNVLTERILTYSTHQNTDPRKGYVYLWNNKAPQEATSPAVKYCDHSTLIYQTANMNLPPKDGFLQDKYVWATASTISGSTQVITNSPECK